jgi:transcriptional regulator
MRSPWRPDWTDKKAYPNVNGTSRLQWAWEFLRRNDAYLQLWTEVVQPDFKPADLDSMWERAQRAQRAASQYRFKYYLQDRRGEFIDRFFIVTFPPPPRGNGRPSCCFFPISFTMNKQPDRMARTSLAGCTRMRL